MYVGRVHNSTRYKLAAAERQTCTARGSQPCVSSLSSVHRHPLHDNRTVYPYLPRSLAMPRPEPAASGAAAGPRAAASSGAASSVGGQRAEGTSAAQGDQNRDLEDADREVVRFVKNTQLGISFTKSKKGDVIKVYLTAEASLADEVPDETPTYRRGGFVERSTEGGLRVELSGSEGSLNVQDPKFNKWTTEHAVRDGKRYFDIAATWYKGANARLSIEEMRAYMKMSYQGPTPYSVYAAPWYPSVEDFVETLPYDGSSLKCFFWWPMHGLACLPQLATVLRYLSPYELVSIENARPEPDWLLEHLGGAADRCSGRGQRPTSMAGSTYPCCLARRLSSKLAKHFLRRRWA